MDYIDMEKAQSNQDGEGPQVDEEEAIKWDLDEEDNEDAKLSLIIIGKVWSKRNINANALMTTKKNVWNPSNGMEAKVIGKNKFSFQFYHWRDKYRVLKNQPWHFDMYPICLHDVRGDEIPSEINPQTLPMWVRLYDLPFRGRSNEGNIKNLCNKLCGGDFNILLNSNEKRGGIACDMNTVEEFREAVDLCELRELGCMGYEFTWNNNRAGEENVQERLDRFFANKEWCDLFKAAFVTNLPRRKSEGSC